MPRSGPGSAGKRLAVEQDGARASACSSPSSMRRNVVLPQPEAPTMVQELRPPRSRAGFARARSGRRIPSRRCRGRRRSSARPCAPRPGTRETRRARPVAQRRVREEGEQRDPGDVGQDHVHRQIAAHQEDAVAEARGRRRSPRPRSGTARPARADRRSASISRGSICGSTTRERDLPGRRAQRLRLDRSAPAAAPPTRSARSRISERRDADDDQHHLGRLAEAEDDEQDRQQRQRRHHRQRRRRTARGSAHIGQQSDRPCRRARARAALIAEPASRGASGSRRCRTTERSSPVRRSGWNAMRGSHRRWRRSAGSSLSSGFSASRAGEAHSIGQPAPRGTAAAPSTKRRAAPGAD